MYTLQSHRRHIVSGTSLAIGRSRTITPAYLLRSTVGTHFERLRRLFLCVAHGRGNAKSAKNDRHVYAPVLERVMWLFLAFISILSSRSQLPDCGKNQSSVCHSHESGRKLDSARIQLMFAGYGSPLSRDDTSVDFSHSLSAWKR